MRIFEIVSRVDSSKTELIRLYNQDFNELMLDFYENNKAKYNWVKREINMLPGFSLVLGPKMKGDEIDSVTVNVVTVPLKCEKCVEDFINQSSEKVNDVLINLPVDLE